MFLRYLLTLTFSVLSSSLLAMDQATLEAKCGLVVTKANSVESILRDPAFFQANVIDPLASLVALPTESKHLSPKEMLAYAHKVARIISRWGKPSNFEVFQLKDHTGNERFADGSYPFILAEWGNNPKVPTVIIYTHYDVVSVRDQNWTTEPFQATVKENGRIYGRGTADDKGGIAMALGTMAALRKIHGAHLPFNVRFIVEGDEEEGSNHLAQLVAERPEIFKGNLFLIPDGANVSTTIPGVTVTARGLDTFTIKVKTGEKPYHGGVSGSHLMPGPTEILIELLGRLWPNKSGLEALARPLSAAEIDLINRSPISAAQWRLDTGLLPQIPTPDFGRSNDNVVPSIARQPRVLINGIKHDSPSGSTVPSFAEAEIKIRTTTGMTHEQIKHWLRTVLAKAVPYNAEVTVESVGSIAPAVINADAPELQISGELIRRAYGASQVEYVFDGGTIPPASILSQALPHLPTILYSVDDPTSGIHGPDESTALSVLQNASVATAFMLYSTIP